MEMINDSPLQAAWMVGKIAPPQWSMTCLVKGTFNLQPGGSPAVLDEEQLSLTGDDHRDQDLEKLLRYPSDFAYFKPHTDLILTGTCYPPNEKPIAMLSVRFRVGAYEKMLTVVGDRRGDTSQEPSDPQPFERVPLTYEYAYGGTGYKQNPIGKGCNYVAYPDGETLYPYPNIEFPQDVTLNTPKREQPAGFGPIPQTWPQRMAKVGTYNKKWLRKRWPWFPEDFDWSFFNAAPQDQQLPNYLNGDESLFFENVHPQHTQYTSKLPGLRVRCFLEERIRASLNFREVPMNLDTLWVDMDQEQLVLVWRGCANVKTEKLEEVLRYFITTEPTDEQPQTPDDCHDAMVTAILKKEEEDEEFESEEPDEDELDEIDEDEDEQLEDEEIEEPIVAVVPAPQPDDSNPAVVAVVAGVQSPTEDDSDDFDLEIEEPPEEPDDDELTVEQVMEKIQNKESLEEAELTDLNLSGVDLSGMNLREAVLEGVNLAKANLAGADLTGATLAGLNLRAANCRGTDLTNADLSEAQLTGADLSQAILQDADLTSADLRQANLRSIRAKDADFSEADLSEADLQDAALTEADLSDTRLHRANLSRASLIEASLTNAWGRNVQAQDAKMQGLKAAGANFCEGQFQRIAGKESVWEECELYGADFSQADLTAAEFSLAYLGWAKFNATELTEAVFDEACLVHAQIVRTKLFDASIQKADLSHANFQESNLYEANLCFSATDSANFDNANMLMVKHTMED